MGSSYRDDLNRGSIPDWEAKLRQSVTLIREVIADIREVIGSDGQFDNAADDGALLERLGIAVDFVLGELPPAKTEVKG